MITMDDIIREGHPSLRQVAKEITFPLSEEQVQRGHDMLTFLKNSQNPEIAEKYGLRGGVGLAAPQLDVLERMIAVHIPGPEAEDEPQFSALMVNPKIVSHSVQEACIQSGEGCLSVDRDVPGYVVRHARLTLSYQDLAGETHKKKLRNYEAIVVQHEIDHLNGVMFYDHINSAQPYALTDNVLVID